MEHRLRNGLVALPTGRWHRFGHSIYMVREQIRRQNEHGDWKWIDVETFVHYDADGRAVNPANSRYDQHHLVKREDHERAELAARRHKDNWL
jgi:hypothetical protein